MLQGEMSFGWNVLHPLRQLKHKVLGLPTFDIADICNEGEKSPNHDEILTSMSNRGCLDNNTIYRDFSSLQIKTPNIVAQTDFSWESGTSYSKIHFWKR